MKKIANFFGVFTSFWIPFFCNCQFCGVLVSAVVEAEDLAQPSLWSSLLWPPYLHLLYWGTVEKMVVGFFSTFPYFFGPFSLYMILLAKEIHWPLAFFIVLTKWFLGRFVSDVCVTFNFISKQVKTVSEKTPSSHKPPRYEISENNFRFDYKSVLLILNVCIVS